MWACTTCGHTQAKWSGSCNECKSWNSFIEEVVQKKVGVRFSHNEKKAAKPVKLSEITTDEFFRLKTNIMEFDRLLGGGLVSGSLTLVAGDPGIGKSTLMLQISNALAVNGLKVLYICGEESAEQTSLRAKRLNINSENLYLLTIFPIAARPEYLLPRRLG